MRLITVTKGKVRKALAAKRSVPVHEPIPLRHRLAILVIARIRRALAIAYRDPDVPVVKYAVVEPMEARTKRVSGLVRQPAPAHDRPLRRAALIEQEAIREWDHHARIDRRDHLGSVRGHNAIAWLAAVPAGNAQAIAELVFLQRLRLVHLAQPEASVPGADGIAVACAVSDAVDLALRLAHIVDAGVKRLVRKKRAVLQPDPDLCVRDFSDVPRPIGLPHQPHAGAIRPIERFIRRPAPSLYIVIFCITLVNARCFHCLRLRLGDFMS